MRRSALKKIMSFILAGLLLSAAGCGQGDGKNDENVSASSGSYCLSEFELPIAEYGEFYKFDTKSIKVLDENGNETDESVGIKNLVWPSGRESKLAGNSIKLTETGTYTVIYQIKGTDILFEKTLICRDGKGPTISFEENIFLPKTAVKGQKVIIPKASAGDLSGIKGETSVRVVDADGEELEIAEGGFVPRKQGEYSIIYSAEDINGNISEETISVEAYDVEAEENVLGYTHIPYGVEQNDGMYRHESYIKELYIPDVTKEIIDDSDGINVTAGKIPALPDGSVSATLITPVADRQRVTYCINSSITDLTDYDYVGFWVYNGAPRAVRVSLNYRSANEFTVESGKWTYLAFNLNAFDYSEKAFCAYNDTGTPVLQPRDCVRKITLRFDYEWKESEFDPSDSYGYEKKGYGGLGYHTYIGKIVAGKFNGPAEFDKPYGSAFFTAYRAEEFPVISETFSEYSELEKEAGTSGSTIFVNKEEQETMAVKLYMFDVPVSEDRKYSLWLKNSNSFSVIFNDGAGNSTVLSPGEERRVDVTLSLCSSEEWQGFGLYDAALSAQEGNLPAGARLCVGALRKI